MIESILYYYVKIKIESPLSIGNGLDELTDHDLIRDDKERPFIPASSIAGVFRSFLSNLEEEIFIPKDKQSPFFISDATIEGEYKTSIRDGVKLDENKTAIDGCKYDIEILESGAILSFRIEVTVREKDNKEEMKKIVEKLIANLNVGNILLGMKSNRGFGKVSIVDFFEKEFNKNQTNESIYEFNKYNVDNYIKCDIPKTDIYSKYDIINIPLKQIGGISIRTYSAKAGDVDYEHVKSNGIPVIPGTSWNGFIRKQVEYYDNYIYKRKEKYIENWFGKYDASQASKVIIEESIINDSKEIEITRNKIDRFSGGTADTALFNEKSNFNGKTILTIKIPREIKIKSSDNEIVINNKYLKGLIGLVIKDIDNGFIALGGQTAIGRGMFKLNGDIKINNNIVNIDDMISEMFADVEVNNE